MLLELIKGCQNNNEQAQRVLYQKYAPLIKGVCMRYEKDNDAVKDLIQDTFIKIFKSIGVFSGNGSLEGWMKKIAINCCIDNINRKKKKNEQLYSEVEEFENIQDNEDEQGQNIISQIIDAGFTKEMLVESLNNLPENYATVFNLYYIDDQSHNFIASSLSITESLSRKWLFRAKELLKKQLVERLQLSKQMAI